MDKVTGQQICCRHCQDRGTGGGAAAMDEAARNDIGGVVVVETAGTDG